MSENSDVFNSRDEIYLVVTKKIFLFYTFYQLHAMSHKNANNEKKSTTQIVLLPNYSSRSN